MEQEKKQYKFFAYLNRLKYINRWNLMRCASTEDVAQHSFSTAVIAHALGCIDKCVFSLATDENKCASIALYHESAEVITGDTPTPVKYGNAALTKAFKEAEADAEDMLLSSLPPQFFETFSALVKPQDSREKQIVKFADKITAYIKCVEEEGAGNREFDGAKQVLFKSIQAFNDKTVAYFMDVFVLSYFKNLDELMK